MIKKFDSVVKELQMSSMAEKNTDFDTMTKGALVSCELTGGSLQTYRGVESNEKI